MESGTAPIDRLIALCGGSINKTAEMLGVTRQTIHNLRTGRSPVMKLHERAIRDAIVELESQAAEAAANGEG